VNDNSHLGQARLIGERTGKYFFSDEFLFGLCRNFNGASPV
jgi:hypothetical protein